MGKGKGKGEMRGFGFRVIGLYGYRVRTRGSG